MTLANLNLITVTGTWVDLSGAPSSGHVRFAPSVVLVDAATNEIIMPSPINVSLDGDGSITIGLPATNDPDISPTGWTWKVTEQINGYPSRQYELEVDVDGGPLDLSDVPRETESGLPSWSNTYTSHVTNTNNPHGLTAADLGVTSVVIDDPDEAAPGDLVAITAATTGGSTPPPPPPEEPPPPVDVVFRGAYSAATADYVSGNQVTYGGHTYQATGTVPAGVYPRGVGDGTTADRQLLLDECVACGEDATGGGLAGALYTVTRTDDYDPATDTPVSGTLRYGLEGVGLGGVDDARWIIVDPSLVASDGTVVIQLTKKAISGASNKTVDGRAAWGGLVIRPDFTANTDRPTIQWTASLATRSLTNVIIGGCRVIGTSDGSTDGGESTNAIKIIGHGQTPPTWTFTDAMIIWTTLDAPGLHSSGSKGDNMGLVANHATGVGWSRCEWRSDRQTAHATGASGHDHNVNQEHSVVRSKFSGYSRVPRAGDGTRLHLVNSLVESWRSNGFEVATDPGAAEGSEGLAEGCIWRAIDRNDPLRLASPNPQTLGSSLTTQEKRATFAKTVSGVRSFMKVVGAYLIANADGDSPVINEDTPGSVWVPSYTTPVTVETANDDLLERINADAGCVSMWEIIS